MLRQRNMWAIGRIRWVVNSGDARMLKTGEGFKPFPFSPIPRDVATLEAGSRALWSIWTRELCLTPSSGFILSSVQISLKSSNCWRGIVSFIIF